MAPQPVRCPECDTTLRTTAAPGAKLRCPRCDASFRVGPEASHVTAGRKEGSAPRVRTVAPDEADDRSERPVRSRSQGRKKISTDGGPTPLFWGIAGGGA